MLEVHRQSGGFTPPVEAKRRSRLSGSKMPQSGAPPVVAKRTSRYRGPVGQMIVLG